MTLNEDSKLAPPPQSITTETELNRKTKPSFLPAQFLNETPL